MAAPTLEKVLNRLPPYRDEWVTIHPDQTVKDIVNEVLAAHSEFESFYDKISSLFDGDSLEDVCNNLYDFCRDNIRYKEETEDDQTTALPTGILVRGHGDCKHYSGFCGGVLDGLTRQGKKIDWYYRFASYDIFKKSPHHVFVVVKTPSRELWIDPTPGSELKTPVYQLDKKSNMALQRNIAGMNGAQVGAPSNVAPDFDPGYNLNFTGKEPALLKGMWPHYMGLNNYADYSGSGGINAAQVAGAINGGVSKAGGSHTVSPDFVQWVYDNSIRSWNFYYPGGVQPNFDGAYWLGVWQKGEGLSGWPALVVTADGRLTFDHDVKLDDYRNAGIHILTAWAQSMINKLDPSPYPLKPRALKEFSQNYTGNPGNPNANLFSEARGTSFFTDIGKSIEKTVQVVKEGVLKVVGFVPRNAFLSLVGLNVLKMADHLQESSNAGQWDEISGIWKDLGGDPDKLQNTIEHGAGQPVITDTNATIDVPADAIGNPAAVIAIITAAAPIIAALMRFLNKDGSLNPAIVATESALNNAFPGNNFKFLDGSLTMNGQPVTWQGAPYTSEGTFGGNVVKNLLIGAAVFGGLYLLMNRRPGVKKKVLLPAGAGVAAFLLLKYRDDRNPTFTPIQQPAQQSLLQAPAGQSLLPAILQTADNIFSTNQAPATDQQFYSV